MTEVLVVVDHVDGTIAKPTLELLAIARRLGEPSAIYFGGGDVPGVLAEHGAEKIYQLDDAAYADFLVAPKAEAIAKIVADTSPAAVLFSSSSEGKEIAARVALKAESGLITDAVDVTADGVTTQSVFAGSYTVKSQVTKGAAIITVKPNAAAIEPAPAAADIEQVDVTLSDLAKAAPITAPRRISSLI